MSGSKHSFSSSHATARKLAKVHACGLAAPAGHACPCGAASGDVTLQIFDVSQLQPADDAVADQRFDVQFNPAAAASDGGCLDGAAVEPNQPFDFRLGQMPVAKRGDGQAPPDGVAFGGRVCTVDHGGKFLLR